MSLRIEVVGSLAEVKAEQWDALAGEDDPFVEHAFLRALETSESVGVEAGWQPLHVTAWRDATLIGALPLYAKDNSWGEFIFDFAWARAAQQAGIEYYPKLVSMAPFTPATGTRFLVLPGEDVREVSAALVAGAQHLAREVDASSVHLLFLTPEERANALAAGMRPRLSYQFHWHNEGYGTFDDYLARFRADKRKQVRKERRCVAQSGLGVEMREGPELSDEDWAALARFYREGVRRYGSYPYLTPRFFDELRANHAERVVAFLAYEGRTPVAASLCFEKGAHLYGRYWGTDRSLGEQDFLHFELCYYLPIERAIARGLRRFEAGAQGMHKMKRGMLPNEVHSAHWVREPRLAAAIDEHLPIEAGHVKAEMAMLSQRSPFHRG
jgi:predicted N-acyltransferase